MSPSRGNHTLCFAILFLLLGANVGVASTDNTPPSCALLFFGLGRKLKEIAYPSIVEYVLAANPTCHVFVHTYNVTKVQGGGRMGEDGSGSVDVEEIFLLADKSHVMIETEEDFQRQRNVEDYRAVFPRPSGWTYPVSMDNMIRQWHSIEKVWETMEAYEEGYLHARYEVVGLFRPDVQYTHPIVITDSTDGSAVIPKLMYETTPKPTKWGGYNDRMFYGKREYAKAWATERFNSVPSYLQWQTTNKNYAVKKGLHSEDFMRWLLVFQFPMPLRMESICFKRIRSSGKIMEGDCVMVFRRKNQHHIQQPPNNGMAPQQQIPPNLRGYVVANQNHAIPNDMDPQQQIPPNLREPPAVANQDHTIENALKEIHTLLLDRATHRICTIVRTHPGHANLLPITLLSLTQQSYRGDDIAMSIFVVNTDSKKYDRSDFMHAAAGDANMKAGHNVVTVLDTSFHLYPPKKAAYGFDVTDRLLTYLLAPDDKNKCTHFLFTNGDNFYSRSLLENIKPALSEGKALIAWDFTSHHKRAYNVISVKFQRGFIDLGSVLVDRRAIDTVKPPLQFLPESIQTRELFARDFFFFKEIYDRVGEQHVGLIHQVLFAHQ